MIDVDPYTGQVINTDQPSAPAQSSALDLARLPKLGSAERSPLKAGLEAAWGGLRYGLPMAAQRDGFAGSQLTPEEEASYQQGLQASVAKANQLLPGGPPSIEDWWSGKAGLGQTIKENLAFSAPQMAAQVGAGFVAGALTKNPGVGTEAFLAARAANAALAGTAVGSPFYVGSNVQRATNDGQTGLSTEQATRSFMAAPVQSALDVLVERFLPIGPLAKTMEGGFLARTAKSIGGAAVTEGVTEPLQQVGERFAAGLDLSSPEATREYLSAAGTAMLSGGALGMFGGIRGKAVSAHPNEIGDRDLEEAVDKVLQLPYYGEGSAEVAPDQMYVGRTGQASLDREAARSTEIDDGAGAQYGTEMQARSMVGQQPLGLPAPSQASVVRQIDTPALTQRAGELVQLIEQGQATEDDQSEAVQLMQELQRRRQQTVSAQNAGPLFTGQLDVDASTLQQEEQNARHAEVTAGIRTAIAKQLQPSDELGLQLQVYEKLLPLEVAGKDWGRQNTELANRLGLVNENGELVDPRGAQQGPTAQQLADEAGIRGQKPRSMSDLDIAMQNDAADRDLSQDVLPLETGLPDRFFRQPEGVTQNDTAPATGNPFATALQPLAQQQENSTRQSQYEAAIAAKQAAEQAQLDADYAKAINERRQQGNPTSPAAAINPQAAWMLRKPANVKSWANLTDEARQQWSDAVVQEPGKQDFAQLRREIGYDNGPVIATDYNITPLAGAQPTADTRDMLNRGANGDIVLTPNQQALVALNEKVDAVFPVDVNLAPEGADKAALFKNAIAAAGRISDPVKQAEAVQKLTALVEQAKTEPLVAEGRPSTYAGEAPLRGGQPAAVEVNPLLQPEQAPRVQLFKVKLTPEIKQQMQRLLNEAIARGMPRLEQIKHITTMMNMRVASDLTSIMDALKPYLGVSANINMLDIPADAVKLQVEEETVHNQLTEEDKQTLADHYDEPSYNDNAKALFINDLVTAINKGIRYVDAAIREIIKSVQQGALALAVIFNPAALTLPTVNVQSQFQTTEMVSIQQVVPADAREKMSPEAQAVYEAMASVAMKQGKGFIIADKPNGVIHVFGAEGQHFATSTALYGKQAGDTLSMSRTAIDNIAKMTDEMRVTPAGQFNVRVVADSHYKEGYVLQLQDTQGRAVGVNENGRGAFVAIHSVFLGRAEEQRNQRLESETAADNKISSGCINTSQEFFGEVITQNKDVLDGGMVFVMPDNVAQTAQMFPAQKVEVAQKQGAGATKTAEMAAGRREQIVADRKDGTTPVAQGLPNRMLSAHVTDAAAAADLQRVEAAFAVVKATGSARAVLRELAKTSDELGKIAQQLLRSMPDIQIRVESGQTMARLAAEAGITLADGEYVDGLYDPKDDRIHLNREMTDPTVVLHEMVHGMVDRHINQRTAIGRELQSIYNRFARHDDGKYGFENAKEFVAELLTNAEFRQGIQILQDAGKVGSLWNRFVAAMQKVFRGTSTDFVDRVLALATAAGEARIARDMGRPSPKIRSATGVRGVDAAMGGMVDRAVAMAENTDVRGMVGQARELAMGWSSLNHLLQRFGDLFQTAKGNGLQQLYSTQQKRGTIFARIGQMFSNTHDEYLKLQKTAPEKAKLVEELMAFTVHDIDPSKNWEAHRDWLKDTPENRKLVHRANQAYKALGAQTGVYTGLKDANEAVRYANMAMALHNLVTSDPLMRANTQGFDANPMDTFIGRATLHETPAEAAKFWQSELQAMMASAEAYLKLERGKASAVGVGKAEVERINTHISPLGTLVKTNKESMDKMQQAPYFHLGRFGDHFVAFTMAKDGKTVDPKVADAVAAELEKVGFGDIVVSGELSKPNTYIRVETVQQRDALEAAVLNLKAKGLLAPDVEIKAGKRSVESEVAHNGASDLWLQRVIEGIRSNGSLTDAEKQKMVTQMREIWLDMLPDTAVAKMMTERKNVQGFSRNMMRAYAFRMQVAAHALAGLATSGDLIGAMSDMREAVKEAQVVGSPNHAEVTTMTDVVAEVSRRNDERILRPSNNFVDTWRAVNHAFFLGASPSYVAVNMTQLGVLLWPELSKKHGFVKSAKAIASASTIAFQIMKATMALGKETGNHRIADATITEAALVRSGINKDVAAFVMRVVNTGNIDIGSAAREMGRVSEGKLDSKLDTTLRYAAMAGYYSETFTRLVAALAARDVHGSKPGLDEYVDRTVNESMLNYSNWNAARQTGKLGFAGQMTPVMLSFMQYQFQVLEKLYRELGHAFLGHAKTDAQKTEARRFLLAHVGAMVGVAGTLGLPFASVVAMVAGKLKDLFDDDEEPFDAAAEWRNMLADMFGKDIGEMVSRGVITRAIGIDISQRAGEQNILPFSKLLTDRRKWEDASKDAAFDTLGSPVSMVANIIQGGRDMLNGEVLKGMQSIVPMAIRGPLQAYEMSEKGYTDAAGNKLPMTPEASDILSRALGFNPAEKAEYTEAKASQTARKLSATTEAGVIRKNLASAIERNDAEAVDEWTTKARKFDANNMAYAVLPGIGSTLKQRAKARAMAEATGTPLGTTRKDAGTSSLTRYANY